MKRIFLILLAFICVMITSYAQTTNENVEDTTPPVISINDLTPGPESATFEVLSSENGSIYWVILPGNSVGWSKEAIRNPENNAIASGHTAVSANTAVQIRITDLPYEEEVREEGYAYADVEDQYVAYFVAEDEANNLSEPANGGFFDVYPPERPHVEDTTRPVITSSSATPGNTPGSVTLAATSNENGTIYWSLSPAADRTSITTGSASATANTAIQVNLTDLSPGTSYIATFSAYDEANNPSFPVDAPFLTTGTSETPVSTEDNIPPIVTASSATPGNTPGSVTLEATSNENGTIYWLIMPFPEPPFPYGGSVSGHVSATANTAIQVSLTDLNPGTSYTASFVALDEANNSSHFVETAPFTTPVATDTTTPEDSTPGLFTTTTTMVNREEHVMMSDTYRVITAYSSGSLQGRWQYKSTGRQGEDRGWKDFPPLNEKYFAISGNVRFEPQGNEDTSTGTKPFIIAQAFKIRSDQYEILQDASRFDEPTRSPRHDGRMVKIRIVPLQKPVLDASRGTTSMSFSEDEPTPAAYAPDIFKVTDAEGSRYLFSNYIVNGYDHNNIPGRVITQVQDLSKGKWQYRAEQSPQGLGIDISERNFDEWQDIPALNEKYFYLHYAQVRFLPNEGESPCTATDCPSLTIKGLNTRRLPTETTRQTGLYDPSNFGAYALTEESATFNILEPGPPKFKGTIIGTLYRTIPGELMMIHGDETIQARWMGEVVGEEHALARNFYEYDITSCRVVTAHYPGYGNGTWKYRSIRGNGWQDIPPLNGKYFVLGPGNLIRYVPTSVDYDFEDEGRMQGFAPYISVRAYKPTGTHTFQEPLPSEQTLQDPSSFPENSLSVYPFTLDVFFIRQQKPIMDPTQGTTSIPLSVEGTIPSVSLKDIGKVTDIAGSRSLLGYLEGEIPENKFFSHEKKFFGYGPDSIPDRIITEFSSGSIPGKWQYKQLEEWHDIPALNGGYIWLPLASVRFLPESNANTCPHNIVNPTLTVKGLNASRIEFIPTAPWVFAEEPLSIEEIMRVEETVVDVGADPPSTFGDYAISQDSVIFEVNTITSPVITASSVSLGEAPENATLHVTSSQDGLIYWAVFLATNTSPPRSQVNNVTPAKANVAVNINISDLSPNTEYVAYIIVESHAGSRYRSNLVKEPFTTNSPRYAPNFISTADTLNMVHREEYTDLSSFGGSQYQDPMYMGDVYRVVTAYSSGPLQGKWQYKSTWQYSTIQDWVDFPPLNGKYFVLDNNVRFVPQGNEDTRRGTKPSITVRAFRTTTTQAGRLFQTLQAPSIFDETHLSENTFTLHIKVVPLQKPLLHSDQGTTSFAFSLDEPIPQISAADIFKVTDVKGSRVYFDSEGALHGYDHTHIPGRVITQIGDLEWPSSGWGKWQYREEQHPEGFGTWQDIPALNGKYFYLHFAQIRFLPDAEGFNGFRPAMDTPPSLSIKGINIRRLDLSANINLCRQAGLYAPSDLGAYALTQESAEFSPRNETPPIHISAEETSATVFVGRYTGTYYWIILPTSEDAPNKLQVEEGKKADNSPAAHKGHFQNDKNDQSQTVEGLTASTDYTLYYSYKHYHVKRFGRKSFSTTVNDTTPPTLEASLSYAWTVDNTVNLVIKASSNELGTIYWAPPVAWASPPTAAVIKGAGSRISQRMIQRGAAEAVLSERNGAAHISITYFHGSPARPSRVFYLVAEDVAGNFSEVKTVSYEPPFSIDISAEETSAVLSTSFEFSGEFYWVILPTFEASPSKFQIEEGKKADNSPAAHKGHHPHRRNPQSRTIAGLSAATNYTLYYVTVSPAGVIELFSSKRFRTTGTDPTPPILEVSLSYEWIDDAERFCFNKVRLRINAVSNEQGGIYWTALSGEAEAPSKAQIRSGRTGTRPYGGDITPTTTAISAKDSRGGVGISTSYCEDPEGSYTFYFVAEDGAGNLSEIETVSYPAFSVNISAGNTPTRAVLSTSLQYVGDFYWVLLPSSETAPNKLQVKTPKVNEINAAHRGHIRTSRSSNPAPQSNSIEELTASTDYTLYYVTVSPAGTIKFFGNTSFRTNDNPVDTTPPTISASSAASGSTPESATLEATSNENGSIYWIILPATDPAPSTAEVRNPSTTPSGNASVTANTSIQRNITGLSPSTSYTAYFVAEDEADNLSEIAAESFTTKALRPHFIKTTGDYTMVNRREILFPYWIGDLTGERFKRSETRTIFRVFTAHSSGSLTGKWQYRRQPEAGAAAVWVNFPPLNGKYFALAQSTRIRFLPVGNEDTSTGTRPFITVKAFKPSVATETLKNPSDFDENGLSDNAFTLSLRIIALQKPVMDPLQGTVSIHFSVGEAPSSVAVKDIGRVTDIAGSRSFFDHYELFGYAPDNMPDRVITHFSNGSIQGKWQYKTTGTWKDMPTLNGDYFYLPFVQLRFLPENNESTETAGALRPTLTVKGLSPRRIKTNRYLPPFRVFVEEPLSPEDDIFFTEEAIISRAYFNDYALSNESATLEVSIATPPSIAEPGNTNAEESDNEAEPEGPENEEISTESETIQPYPNPTQDYVQFRGLAPEKDSYTYKIYTFSGAFCLSGAVSSTGAIDISTLGQGHHVVILYASDGKMLRRRFIVR